MMISDLKQFSLVLGVNRSIISVDYGKIKLGIAISNPECTVAMPVKSLHNLDEAGKVTAILKLADQYLAGGVVIGLPITMKGEANIQAQLVQNFAAYFATKTSLPIYLQDERLTTAAANNLLKSFGLKRKQRNKQDDSTAASMILETVLAAMQTI